MIDIPLQAIANQSLSIPLDGQRFTITVKEANGGMVCTVAINDVVVIQNTRLVADGFVLPYDYLHPGFGNLFMGVQDEQVPWWEQFGLTQSMVYATADEIASA